jgi:hypothetical protein
MNINKFVLLILLGAMVLELNAKPKYRIETWVTNGERQYLPQKRVWYKTNYFYLPFKIWHSGSYSFKYQSQAEEIIKNWKEDEKAKKEWRQSTFIEVE